jgi:hypothetical protein
LAANGCRVFGWRAPFKKHDCSSSVEVNMVDVERYEMLVIGSGEAGKHVTWTFAQASHRTSDPAVEPRRIFGRR